MRLDYKSTQYEYNDERFIIKFKYLMDHKKEKGVWITYTVTNSAEIIIDVSYEKLDGIEELSLLGLRFELLKDKKELVYYGLSGETYPDRKAGGVIGVHHLDVKNGYTNYMTPQECGNHEETRWLIVNGSKSSLKVEQNKQPFKFKFMEYSDFDIDNATHFEELSTTALRTANEKEPHEPQHYRRKHPRQQQFQPVRRLRGRIVIRRDNAKIRLLQHQRI